MLGEGPRLFGEPSLDNANIKKKNGGRVHSHQPVKEILKTVPQTASVVVPALLGIVFSAPQGAEMRKGLVFFTFEKAWLSLALITKALSLHQISCLKWSEWEGDQAHRQLS